MERNLAPDVPPEDRAALVAGLNQFAFELFVEVRDEPEMGNLFFSPLSIHQALGMTWAGARGTTELAMAETMRFAPAEQARFHSASNALDLALASREDFEPADCVPDVDCGDPFRLRIANAIWGQTGYPFLEAFLDILGLNYGAGLRLVDFLGDHEAARARINAWVEERTEDRIRDLLPEGSITPDTVLVLTNAIYFKASWATQFIEGATRDAPFRLHDGQEVMVPTMRLMGELDVHVDPGAATIVRLPYVGGQLAMWIVMPDGEGGAQSVEDAMDAGTFAHFRTLPRLRNVDLQLPKFTFETDLPLTDHLKAMGMEVAFVGEADFSGMNGTGGLMITAVFHKAFVGIDETGTEAAAATAVVVGRDSEPDAPIEVAIDRPFLFFVVDEPTDAILFFGRMRDPR